MKVSIVRSVFTFGVLNRCILGDIPDVYMCIKSLKTQSLLRISRGLTTLNVETVRWV